MAEPTVFDICERAVGLVRGHRLDISLEARVNALDYRRLISDRAQEEAVNCVRHFPGARDGLLHAWPWVFARRSATPARLATPLPGWAYSYALPADCVRLMGLAWSGGDVPAWTQEGNVVGCDRDAAIHYTSRGVSVGQWPPLFVDALVLRLASEICVAVQGDVSALPALERRFEITMAEAWRSGAVDTRSGLPLDGYGWDGYSRSPE